MRIAILSDIHDNVWKLAAALEAVRHADVLLCCGDLYRITANARPYETSAFMANCSAASSTGAASP